MDAVEYWKDKTEKADQHAKDMALAMYKANRHLLKAARTNRVIEALAIIGEALAKHDRYLPPKNRMQ